MSLLSIAALALQAGPALIRGVSSMFGGSDVAEKVASAVETVQSVSGLDSNQKAAKAADILEKCRFSPDELQELNSFKIALEKEVTERMAILAKDRQSEHMTTASVIKSGDNATDRLVRLARPLMALISCCSGSYYVITDPAPDMVVASVLFAISATYMGMRHREKDKGIV